MRILRTAAATLAATAALVASAGSAQAELYGIDDPAETTNDSNIEALSVRNGLATVHVVVKHTDLRANGGVGGTTYIDTNRQDSGPEYVLTGGYFDGTDYVLLETEGWPRKFWGGPVSTGDYSLQLNYKRDTVRLDISRKALGKPGKIRVTQHSGETINGTEVDDWVGAFREWGTPWIARG